MTSQQRETRQIAICDLADKLLNDALAKGHPFSEGLCNWAMSEAERLL